MPRQGSAQLLKGIFLQTVSASVAIDFHGNAIGNFFPSLPPSLFFSVSHLFHFVSGLCRVCRNLARVSAGRLGAQWLFSLDSIEIFLTTVKST